MTRDWSRLDRLTRHRLYMDFEERFDGNIGTIITTQLSVMHSIAMNLIPICYLPIHCVWFVVSVSLSLSVLSVHRVQCIESYDGRRHKVDDQREPSSGHHGQCSRAALDGTTDRVHRHYERI